jgi:uncharacterized membrane-anchored protein YhcB (DUF1043 family)
VCRGEVKDPVTGWFLALLLLVVAALGAVAGYYACYRRQLRLGGGKTAGALRTELDEHKREAAAHFERSAVLLHELGVQFAELYKHLADGAARLAGPTAEGERIGFQELERLVATRAARGSDPEPAPATLTLGLRPDSERNSDPPF